MLTMLKFSYNIDIKFGTYPHCKFKSNIFMSICTSITTRFCLYSNCVSSGNKFFYTDFKTIKTGTTFNYGAVSFNAFFYQKARLMITFEVYASPLQIIQNIGFHAFKHIFAVGFLKCSSGNIFI